MLPLITKSIACLWLIVLILSRTHWRQDGLRRGDPDSSVSKAQAGEAEQGKKDLHRSYQTAHRRKTSTAMQIRSKWYLKQRMVKRASGRQGAQQYFCVCNTHRQLFAFLTCGLKGLSRFTTTATSVLWGRTNHDLRVVETALETIVLCAGEELRRGLAGQSLLSGPAGRQQLSQPLPVSLSHMQSQFSMTLT